MCVLLILKYFISWVYSKYICTGWMKKKKVQGVWNLREQVVLNLPVLLFIFAIAFIFFIVVWVLFEIHNQTKTTFVIYPYLLLFLKKRGMFFSLTFFLGVRTTLAHALMFVIFPNPLFRMKPENPWLVCSMVSSQSLPGSSELSIEPSGSKRLRSPSPVESEVFFERSKRHNSSISTNPWAGLPKGTPAPGLDKLLDAADNFEIVDMLHDPKVPIKKQFELIKTSFIKSHVPNPGPYHPTKQTALPEDFYDMRFADLERFFPQTEAGEAWSRKVYTMMATIDLIPDPIFQQKVKEVVDACMKLYKEKGQTAYITRQNFKWGLLYAGHIHGTHPYWLLMGEFNNVVQTVYYGGLLERNHDFWEGPYIKKRCKENPILKNNVMKILNGLNSLPVHRKGGHNFTYDDVIYGIPDWFFYRRQGLNIYEVLAANPLSPERAKEIIDFINQTWGLRPTVEYPRENR